MPHSKFRVIVVGGGPVGLTAAHMFSKAGIDFMLLEQWDTVTPDIGTSLAVLPHTLRVYDQLDLLESVGRIDEHLCLKTSVTHEGRIFNIVNSFAWYTENHGHGLVMTHRPHLLQLLYNELRDADRAKILTGKSVVDIRTDVDGVVVECADGTSVEGSIVVGADGVRSKVRDIMRSLALKESPDAVVNVENPFLTSYRCLFGMSPLLPGLVPGETWESHGHGASSQIFVGPDKATYFLYERLDTPRRERARYSEKDKEQCVERLGYLAVTDKLKFRDLWHTTTNSVLTDLEEGTVKVSAWDRLAIVGDAANKQTPNSGFGYNSGVQDLVVLTTGLRRLLDDTPDDEQVDAKLLRRVLREYQEARIEDATRTCSKSAQTTRMHTWANWPLWLLARYILPHSTTLSRWMFTKIVSEWVMKGQVLPFLEEKSLRCGKIPWVNMPEVKMEQLRR